ncbi:MAG: PVC-type heme-binding CxxCH protein [Pirellulales bacterium]
MHGTSLAALGVMVFAAGLAQAQGLSPQAAVQRMAIADGFESQLVASEPLVRQPVCIEFDDRGRLWVIQYLQYPNPAGLNRVRVDRYSRTKYDRVPKPPPRGPRGADRITILEDTDGDGRMDRGQDFLQGLNLATGMAFGHGGVFVLNVPYLLFYADKNRDDVPDGDPQVLLEGFGMEDAHSVANSLTWGPDGWLYGCQGSTVSASIRGIEFQQGVWRYHPVTQKFELFCEGGGNSWGLDFDRQGRLLYSTNYGGFVLLHGLQGAYLVKSFGKHGALHNPHAYGFFEHAPHRNFLGGHVTVGGIVYQEDAFPESFRGKYIAGDLLGHGVYWHHIEPRGSSVQTAHGGELLLANDNWFATTDITTGPDGAVYVADWHDARTAHPDPDAEWDRSNGRIYRIAPRAAPPAPTRDLARLDTQEVLKLLRHPGQWHVRHARQELVRRQDASAVPPLRQQLLGATDEATALEALWTLASLGSFEEGLAESLLSSPHAAVRAWAIRLMGDTGKVSADMAHRLDDLAELEPDVFVRQQIACTAARLPAAQAMPLINANINRDIDGDDPCLPLLWWWAVEKHSVSGRDEVMRRFIRPTLWKSRLGRDELLPRLVRRYAAEGSQAGLDCLVQLINAGPNDDARDTLWLPLLQGWREAPRGQDDAPLALVPEHDLSRWILARWHTRPDDRVLLQLALAVGLREPFERLLIEANRPTVDSGRRVELLSLLAETGDIAAVAPLLSALEADAPDAANATAIAALSRYDDPRIATALLALYAGTRSEDLRFKIRDALLGRKGSAGQLLALVDQGDLPAASIPLEQVRKVALLAEPDLDELVRKHWGKLDGATREEKLAEVRRLNNDLNAGTGDTAAGKVVFKKHCAACHQLFGEGTRLGPDLTAANRTDRDFLLVSLVDPSSVIRKEYVSLIVQTIDGRVLTGLAVSRDDAGVTLVNAKNEKVTISSGEIEDIAEGPASLMPDELHRQIKPQDLRDLFAYLQTSHQ